MKAVVLEKKGEISIRDVEKDLTLGPKDVEVKIQACGVCGSDVHYYTHGKIGPYVVEKPMILGHETAGVITKVGSEVTNLKVGDRVCLEPGIPHYDSPETLSGYYNLDPNVTFFATPPVDGCLIERVVHPAAFCFKLPDELSFYEGAMVEPVAIGMQAATKAEIKPGDIGIVFGAGTIGIVTALSALAGGCADVIVVDMLQDKLNIAGSYKNIHPVNLKTDDLDKVVDDLTAGRGCDVVFECSGAAPAILTIAKHARPAANVVLVGMPVDPVPFDVVAAQGKELNFKTIFRYANMYPRTLRLMRSGALDVKRLVSQVYDFNDAIAAFDRAASGSPTDVKIMIDLTKL